MASTPLAEAGAAKGAKKRTGIPTMTRSSIPRASSSSTSAAQPEQVRRVIEDGLDSGLSSESTTPTNGSPPARKPQIQPLPAGQIPRRKMVDIIAASKARLQLAEERLSNNRTRLLHNRSNADSPRSIDSGRSRQVFSPLRTPRNVQSPSLDSGDEGSLRIERGTYSYMFQDIVSIKTMLLKLKRVLQESGENGLTRTDPLNPFDNSLKNGLLYNLNDGNSTTDGSLNEGRDTIVEELADLRRQVVFLQGQVDEKDKTILTLQEQLAKYQNGDATNGAPALLNGKDEPREMTNAATQTDKLRPLSTGASLLQGLSQDGSGSIVSLNDLWTSEQQRPSTLALESQPHQQQQHHHQQSTSHSATSSPSCSRSTSRRSSEQRPSRLRPPSSPQQQQHHNHNHQQQQLATDSTRSSIPTPRRLGTPTLIPRVARAVSATGRAHNS